MWPETCPSLSETRRRRNDARLSSGVIFGADPLAWRAIGNAPSPIRYYTTERDLMVSSKQNLLNLVPAEAERLLREFATANGEPAYRGQQVALRLWRNPAPGFAAMTELPVAFRELLDQHFMIPRLEIVTR